MILNDLNWNLFLFSCSITVLRLSLGSSHTDTSVSQHSLKIDPSMVQFHYVRATAIRPRTSSSACLPIGSQVTDGTNMQLLHFLRCATKAAANYLPLLKSCTISLVIRIVHYVTRRRAIVLPCMRGVPEENLYPGSARRYCTNKLLIIQTRDVLVRYLKHMQFICLMGVNDV